MAQTVASLKLLDGQQKIFFKKPHVLRRIFCSIAVLAADSVWQQSWISFGDPLFSSFYSLNGQHRYFEAKGDGISQRDIWVRNNSGASLIYTGLEILAEQC